MWFLWSAKPAKNGNVTKVPFSASGGATGTDDAHGFLLIMQMQQEISFGHPGLE